MKTKKESKSKSGKGKVQGQIQPVTLFSKAESQAALDLFDAEGERTTPTTTGKARGLRLIY